MFSKKTAVIFLVFIAIFSQGCSGQGGQLAFDHGAESAKNGNFDQAIADFSEAIKNNPQNAAAYTNRGQAYQAKGKPDRALADFSKALELYPQDAKILANRAAINLELGNDDAAIADFARLIELSPPAASTYTNRGDAYRHKRDLDAAIADYDKAIDLDPKFALAWNNRGVAYAAKANFEQANFDFKKAMESDPSSPLPYLSRGDEYAARGDLFADAAISDYNKAIDLDPQLSRAWYKRAQLYKQRGFTDIAISSLGSAISVNPNSVPPYLLRGDEYRELGNFDGALADYSRAIELDGKSALAYSDRALAYAAKSSFDQAFADATKALEIDPELGAGYAARGEAYRLQNKLDLALDDLNKAIELTPQLASAYNSRALIFMSKNDPDKARPDLVQAIRLDSKYLTTPWPAPQGITFKFEPGAAPDLGQEIVRNVSMAQYYFGEPYKVTVIAAGNPNALSVMDPTLSATGIQTMLTSGMVYGGLGKIWITTSAYYGSSLGNARLHTVAHEYFHTYEAQLSRSTLRTVFTAVDRAGPQWFIEGGAEFAADRVLVFFGLSFFSKCNANASMFKTPLSKMEKRADVEAETGIAGMYVLGCQAVKYLAAKYGERKVLHDYWKTVGAGGYWADAFKETFGLSPEKFYDEFEKLRKEGFPPNPSATPKP